MNPDRIFEGRSTIRMFNMDCMDFLNECEENEYELAIVDPEYGLDAGNYSDKPCRVKQKNGAVLNVSKPTYKKSDWDKEPVSFETLLSIEKNSKKQIIWGGNYFGLRGGYLVWDKMNHDTDQFDIEMAWLSWTLRTDRVYYLWSGMMQGKAPSNRFEVANYQIGDKSKNEKRIHPTQKPVKLYRWLLQNYATEGDTILDTHGGSMSIAIACWEEGFDLDICEIDRDYFNDGVKRFDQHITQMQLF